MRCLLENVVIFLAIPIVTGFHYYTLHNSYVHSTKGVWSGYYDETLKQWSGNAVKGAWQTTFQTEVNITASMAAVAIVFLVLFIVAIQPVVGSLKKVNHRISDGE